MCACVPICDEIYVCMVLFAVAKMKTFPRHKYELIKNDWVFKLKIFHFLSAYTVYCVYYTNTH